MTARKPSETVKRDRRVLELRRKGLTFDKIAEQVGLANKGSAQKAYKRALERTGGPEMDQDQARAQQIDRLHKLRSAFWPKATRGDPQAGRLVLHIERHITHVQGLALSTAKTVPLPDDGDGDGTVVPASRMEELRKELKRDSSGSAGTS